MECIEKIFSYLFSSYRFFSLWLFHNEHGFCGGVDLIVTLACLEFLQNDGWGGWGGWKRTLRGSRGCQTRFLLNLGLDAWALRINLEECGFFIRLIIFGTNRHKNVAIILDRLTFSFLGFPNLPFKESAFVSTMATVIPSPHFMVDMLEVLATIELK